MKTGKHILGRKLSKETREKISITQKKRNNFNWKKGHIPWNKGLIGWHSGAENPAWKGGVKKRYKTIRDNGIQKFLHRKIVKDFLKRELNSKEIIHHINKNIFDNRIENLYLFDNQNKHRKAHLNNRLPFQTNLYELRT